MDGWQGRSEKVTELTSANDDHVIKSARRVMQVFEFFGERREPINATEIARSLGFPQSSTSMLLKSLVTLGYLEYRHDTRTFRPTIRISLLGAWAPERVSIADRLLTLLRRVQEFCGGTVLLGAQHNNFLRCIFVLPEKGAIRSEIPTGALLPLCTNAMGLALLTLKAESEVRAIVRRTNAEEKDAERRLNVGSVFEQIETYRSTGFLRSETRDIAPQSTMFAMLLPPHEDEPPLCIGVLVPTRRVRPHENTIVSSMAELVAGSENRRGAGYDRSAVCVRSSAEGRSEERSRTPSRFHPASALEMP